jgi:hypothetical protein
MVPKVGIEPTHLAVLDFESGVSISLPKPCNFGLGYFKIMLKKLRCRNNLCQTQNPNQPCNTALTQISIRDPYSRHGSNLA